MDGYLHHCQKQIQVHSTVYCLYSECVYINILYITTHVQYIKLHYQFNVYSKTHHTVHH